MKFTCKCIILILKLIFCYFNYFIIYAIDLWRHPKQCYFFAVKVTELTQLEFIIPLIKSVDACVGIGISMGSVNILRCEYREYMFNNRRRRLIPCNDKSDNTTDKHRISEGRIGPPIEGNRALSPERSQRVGHMARWGPLGDEWHYSL